MVNPLMTLKKSIAFAALTGLVLLLLAGGGLVYLWKHPAILQSILEDQFSSRLGYAVRMDSLSYSLRPLQIRMQGLSIGDQPARTTGFHAHVSEFTLRLERTGPFADTILMLHPEVAGLRMRITPGFDPGDLWIKQGEPSLWGRIAAQFAGFFLFEEVRIGQILLKQGDVRLERSDLQLRLRKISARLSSDDRLVLSCQAMASRPKDDLELHLPVVECSTPNRFSLEEPVLQARFRLRRGIISSPVLEAEDLDLDLEAAYERSAATLTLRRIDLGLSCERSGEPALNRLLPAAVQVQGQGACLFKEQELVLDQFHCRSNALLDFKGGLRIAGKDTARLHLNIAKGRLQTTAIREALSIAFSEPMAGVDLSGPLDLSGTVNAEAKPDAWTLGLDLRAGLDGLQVGLDRDEIGVRSTVNGHLTLQGQWPGALQLQGSIASEGTRLRLPGLDVQPFSLAGSFQGSYPRLQITNGTAEIPKARVARAGQQFSLKSLGLRMPAATLDVQQGSIEVPALHLQSQSFDRLVLSLQHSARKSELTLQETDLRLTDLARDLNLLPQGWTVGAAEDLGLTLLREQGRPLRARARLEFEDLAFSNASETMLGEGLTGAWRLSGRFEEDALQVVAESSLEIDQGEVLLDRFYVNLQKKPLTVSGSCAYALQEMRVSAIDFQVRLQDLLGFSTQGWLAFKGQTLKGRLNLQVPRTRVQPVFQTLVQEPYQMDVPIVADIAMQGRVGAELQMDSPGEGWRIKGSCSLDLDHLHFQDHAFGLERLELEMPLWYEQQAAGIPRNWITGRAAIKKFFAPGLPEQDLQLEVKAGPNELIVHESAPVQTLGGGVSLGPLRINRLFSDTRRLETRLEVRDFSLAPALKRLFQTPVHGSLSGTLDPVVLEKGRLQTRGGLQARIFNGVIDFFDIKAHNVFSPVPSFGLSAEFHGLDLAGMTTKTDFGRIQGVLEGSVDNLQIAAGQPQAFDLRLETVKTRGVDQKISVRAVDNIARIGGGQSPFMGFAGALAAVFKNFSYRKIGIKARLENDRFQINGTIREQGTEYLIKRRGLTGVNIVNSNPDNQISFKDMLKRIRRVTSGQGQVRVE